MPTPSSSEPPDKAYNYPSILFFILAIFWGPKFHFTTRIYVSLVLNLIALVITPVLHFFFAKPEASSGDGVDMVQLGVTLALVVLTGAACSIYFGAMMGLAALFPGTYTGAIMIGNGIAGIIVIVLRIITKLAMAGQELASGSLYFYLSAGIIVLCIVTFFLMTRTAYYKFHIDRYERTKDLSKGGEEEQPLVLAGDTPGPKVRVLTVLGKIWKEAALVWLVFFITIVLYPGVTSLIQPRCKSGEDSGASGSCERDINPDWFTIIMIALFMVGDFVGRTTAGNFSLGLNAKTLWIPNLLRLAYIPLFLLSVVPLGDPYINNDWVAFLIMLTFALSNGYVGTRAMIYGPDPVESHEKETAGIIMAGTVALPELGVVFFFLS